MSYSILSQLGEQRFAAFVGCDALALWQDADKTQLQMALAQSDFIFASLQQQPSLIGWLFERRALHERAQGYAEKLACRLSAVGSEEELWRALRQFRRQELLWLAWQDFTRQIPLSVSFAHLSALAQSIVLSAYHYLYQNCCNLWGTPCDQAGNALPLLILAMGKLGGEELNFSSDIDLIFAYPSDGQTRGGARSLENVQFFTRLGQRLIKALELPTVDGFCYRVDLRLRPFGESGPLVMSFAALESYYQTQGRDWERYAMIKARVLGAQDFMPHSLALRKLLWPFVFRRYSDFSAIDSVRRMKSMIQAELRRRDLVDNIKLGAGGIREIEFIAQTFQLIRGGKEPLLQQRGLPQTVSALLQLELINHDDFTILSNAYSHLRQLENLLQAIADQQTQTLPSAQLDRLRLAAAFAAPDWEALVLITKQHMSAVHAIFLSLFGEPKALVSGAGDAAQDYQEICDCLFNSLHAKNIFAEQAHILTPAQQELLWQFGQDLKKRTVGARGQEILNQLVPALLQRILQQNSDAEAFHGAHCVLERVLNIVLAVASRTTYLELLTRYPAVLEPLIQLCGKSAMIANQLAAHPMLLDELLLSQKLYQPTPFTQYGSALQEFLARIPQDDQELLMEQIRQFKQLQLLRIAAADVAGQLPVMRVSDHLTYLAQAIVTAVVEQTWQQMRARYGEPAHLSNSGRRGFLVLAFGKLGGIELGYASDLDLVFLYDDEQDQMSDGAKSISVQQFYLRLAQRIVHLFAARTAAGVLYELDMRLRPSGEAGLLITSMASFANYQREKAWTWEHQTLVRARAIFGDEKMCQQFERLREEILCAPRSPSALKEQVHTMRQKMREHQRAPADKSSLQHWLFTLKHGRGGIVDIEFLTQFWVLAFAHKVPAIATWSDNMRILDDLALHNIVEAAQVQSLQSAYLSLRTEIHRVSLLQADPNVGLDEALPPATASPFAAVFATVADIWEQWLGE